MCIRQLTHNAIVLRILIIFFLFLKHLFHNKQHTRNDCNNKIRTVLQRMKKSKKCSLYLNIYFKYAWTDAFILYPTRDTLYCYFISDTIVLYAFDNLIANVYILFFFCRCSNNITCERSEAIHTYVHIYCIEYSIFRRFSVHIHLIFKRASKYRGNHVYMVGIASRKTHIETLSSNNFQRLKCEDSARVRKYIFSLVL